MAKTGRKQLEIDSDLVEKLATIHCTMAEIAAICDCSVDTLERRFAEVIKKGKEKGKTSLRRFQWLAAEKGNVTMLIWLGKSILGQREIVEQVVTEKPVLSPTDDELAQKISQALKKLD